MGGTTSNPRNVYGWKRDTVDQRDKYMKFKKDHYINIRKKVDLRDQFGVVYDQGELGSCTANAICGAYSYDQKKQKQQSFDPSRLFLYYNERDMEHTTHEDSGASIRDGMKALNRYGVCQEILWPYDIDHFTSRPYDDCYYNARSHRSIKYKRIQNQLNELKTALSNGYPITFGFDVYQNFEEFNASQETMPFPEGKLLGGHAVLAVGYSDERQCFLIRNSWGAQWGINGYFMMPYDFIVSEHCADFWVLEKVMEQKPKLVEEFKSKPMSYVELDVNLNDYIKPNKTVKPNKPRKIENDKTQDILEAEEVLKFNIEKDNILPTSDCLIRDED